MARSSTEEIQTATTAKKKKVPLFVAYSIFFLYFDATHQLRVLQPTVRHKNKSKKDKKKDPVQALTPPHLEGQQMIPTHAQVN